MKIMDRDFKLEGIGIPDTPIKPLIDKEFVYDFEYIVNDNANNYVEYNNKKVNTRRYITKLLKQNINDLPDELNGIEVFRAVNPFDETDFTRTFSCTYNFDLVALLFKLGYCDGVTLFTGDATNPCTFLTPIVVVDPEKRKIVRDYFEKLYGNDLDLLKIEDFGWGELFIIIIQ